ncbi:MAG TPA: portal protein [Caulobacteraceae bacterium]|jgi:hypothetical protein
MADGEVRDRNDRIQEYLAEFEAHRSERIEYDVKWQLVSDYILPRRDFTVTLRPNQIRPHRVTSSLATNANSRMSAMLLTYAIDTSRPFMMPNVKHGLGLVGRSTQLSDAAINYLDGVQDIAFDATLRPKANYLMRMTAMLQEFCSFGPGITFTGRQPGFGPIFTSRPVNACWWGINENEDIDNLHYRFRLPMYRVRDRWPETFAKLYPEYDDRQDTLLSYVDILQVTRPRRGGRRGAVPSGKSFEHVSICMEGGREALLDESGFDDFPYNVFRFNPRPGTAYCEGPGCQVLPDVMVLNHLIQAIENAASQKAEPAVAMPARMFAKNVLDRRPGAINTYNPAGLGLQRADQAIIKLDLTGDPTMAMQYAKELMDNIREGYMWDVFQLREAGDMTAEEVNARMDLNMRGAASVVSYMGAEMSRQADRILDILVKDGKIPPPPRELSGASVDWEYAGPLQIAQLTKNADNIMQMINARALVMQQGPEGQAAAMAIDLETCLRVLHDYKGAPPGIQNSHAKVEAYRQAMQQAQAQAQGADNFAKTAKGASDASNAASTAMGAIKDYAGAPGGAAPGGGGPAPQAPFAPAAPFAQAA